MKKLCIALAMMIVLSLACSPLALGLSSSNERPTVLSFTELFSKRLIELENNAGYDLSSSLLGMEFPVTGLLNHDGLIVASSLAGSVGFDEKTLVVGEWSNMLMRLGDDAEKTVQNVFLCVVAISALEYGHLDELSLMREGITPELKIYNDVIDPIWIGLSSTALKLKAQNKSKLIYEGKYSYYISCSETSDGTDVVWISAE